MPKSLIQHSDPLQSMDQYIVASLENRELTEFQKMSQNNVYHLKAEHINSYCYHSKIEEIYGRLNRVQKVKK